MGHARDFRVCSVPEMKTVPSEPLRLPAHLPALDGLRGVAVLLVIAYHSLTVLTTASVGRLFQVGWAGVDLFFVALRGSSRLGARPVRG
jgi:uncharacterized membrane protein